MMRISRPWGVFSTEQSNTGGKRKTEMGKRKTEMEKVIMQSGEESKADIPLRDWCAFYAELDGDYEVEEGVKKARVDEPSKKKKAETESETVGVLEKESKGRRGGDGFEVCGRPVYVDSHNFVWMKKWGLTSKDMRVYYSVPKFRTSKTKFAPPTQADIELANAEFIRARRNGTINV